jgi:hypothetical protein
MLTFWVSRQRYSSTAIFEWDPQVSCTGPRHAELQLRLSREHPSCCWRPCSSLWCKPSFSIHATRSSIYSSCLCPYLGRSFCSFNCGGLSFLRRYRNSKFRSLRWGSIPKGNDCCHHCWFSNLGKFWIANSRDKSSSVVESRCQIRRGRKCWSIQCLSCWGCRWRTAGYLCEHHWNNYSGAILSTLCIHWPLKFVIAVDCFAGNYTNPNNASSRLYTNINSCHNQHMPGLRRFLLN